MNNNICIGYIFGIILTLLIVIGLFTWSYNDDVEKEYFSNFQKLDEALQLL